ncbi:MAG: hypothetical protein RLZZ09_2850 [Pseudomonadota bacterium]
MRITRFVLLVVMAWGLTACQNTFFRMSSTATPPSDPQAESLLRSGDYAGAAERYQQLALSSRSPDHYFLEAADAALRAGDGVMAINMTNGIRPSELNPTDNDHYLLLTGRLDLNEGKAREALTKLNRLSDRTLSRQDAKNYHILRASAENQLGDMIASARERVALGKLLTRPVDVQRNNEVIHDTLERVPARQLLDKQPPPPDELGGWMALTYLLKNTPGAGLAAATAQWRTRYPGHPANGAFLQRALADAGQGSASAQPAMASGGDAGNSLPTGPFIGVLLPLTGPYASASEAIRTGMMTAQAADRNGNKPELFFSDSTEGDIYQNYRRMADNGATMMVGPLIKDDVSALASGGDLPVPVLALNQVNDLRNPRIFQFGLTPEQEVEQVAGSAWLDGKREAILMAPESAFGKRLAEYFDLYWQSLGGRIIERRKYSAEAADASMLAKILPANAEDAFVFLVADAKNARSIVPKLTSVSQVPIYATSHVFDGHINEPGNTALDGLIFCDMPWLLNPNEGGDLSAQSLDGEIRQTKADSVKLLAMGLDAYRLVSEIDHLKADSYNRYAGATGSLSLQADQRIQRQLECAQFSGGSLRPRGIAPVLKSNMPQ